MSSWTAHRNPTHFPEPEAFQPSRWMTGALDAETTDGEGRGGTEAMKKLYMPFTKGMYKCIGQAMAMRIMRVTVATLVLRYDIKLAEDATLADMDWDDHFSVIPRRGCFLDFTPV
jgi:cytochrome P450